MSAENDRKYLDMRQHLSNLDEKKLQAVLEIKEAYLHGRLPLAEAKVRMKNEVGTMKAYEIALVEQKLQEFEHDQCEKADIQKMMELFEDVMDTTAPELPEDHPINCYYRENDAMRGLLLEIEELLAKPFIKNPWVELYEKLSQYRVHWQRKQMQLYAILEKKGFDRPTTTMWTLDDFVRDEIADAFRLLKQDKDEEFLALQPTIVADVLDLMAKEEQVLYPTSLAMITPEEFEDMKSGDQEIGFAYIKVAGSKRAEAAQAPQGGMADLATELAALLGKHGIGGGNATGELDVATGRLTLEQINLIFRHMPVDLSYVDENEIVKFYTDTEHRIFPRSKNVIGRDVKNCHPRNSVHIVQSIVEKFRSGEESQAEFWINKPDLFIYILYTAVRDENGKFRGILEMMQDCTHIRSLEGSQTLLTWSNGETVEKRKPGEGGPTAPAKKSEGCGCAHAEAPEQAQGACGCQHGEMESHVPASADGLLPITPETRLKDLLEVHPWLKEKLPEINPAFKMLKTPLARIMIPKATVAMMSERSGMPLELLIEALTMEIEKH